jgi:hypothetical protein
MKYENHWVSRHENDGKTIYGGRDVAGYANHPPDPKWPHKAKVALNFVINYEEGGENCLLHGDTQSEHLLSEIVGASAYSKFRLFVCFPNHKTHSNVSLNTSSHFHQSNHSLEQKMNVMVCDLC